MIQEQSSKTWVSVTAAIIVGGCTVIAAIVALGTPFAERYAERYFQSFTPSPENTNQSAYSIDQINITPNQSIEINPTITVEYLLSGELSLFDFDSLFGNNNWHCVDGFPNSISITNVPVGLIVQEPFIHIDKASSTYYPGDTVPSGGPATGWLDRNLPNNQCSSLQPDITQNDLDILLGSGNWRCLILLPTGVTILNIPENFYVISPMVFVDKGEGRYYQGEMVPSGGSATAWFSNEIPVDECQ